MIKRIIIILGILAITMCGCGSSEGVLLNETEVQETGQLIVTGDTENISVDTSKDCVYSELPYFYQDNYDTEFGEDTVCNNGNLVTCLSMLESYYLDSEITPDIFTERHDDLCKQGSDSLNSSQITEFINSLNVGCIEAEFSVKEAVTKLKSLHGFVLVYIPHTSIYGKGGSYLIISGIYNDYFIVHDPSKISENNNKTSYSENGDILYNATQFTLAASTDSKMWVIY